MPDLPRPRSQLPILTHFTLPLPNTDSFYFSQELWDPSTRQPLKNEYRLKPTLKKKGTTMPSVASKKKVVPLKERSSQIDQLESDTEPATAPAPVQENNKINKRTTSKDKHKGKGKAKEKEKDKEITRIVKSTKPSTTSSKRKRSTSPSHSDESTTERQLKPTRSHSVDRMKEKLEKFRCGLIKSDDTPSNETTPQQSSEPLKRRRPSKDPSPSRALARQSEETELNKKRKKKRTESTEILEDPVPVQPRPPKQKKEEPVVYFCPEVDEDGNPIDPTSPQPSPSPTHSLNQELSPTPFHHSPPRSASPINQSESRQPLVSSPQKLNNTSLTFRPPAQLEKPSPFRPTRHPLSSQVAVKPTSKQDRPDFPSSSSSNSFNLPSQMAERIRLSGSSPAPDQHELDEVQRGRLSSGRQPLSAEQKKEVEEFIEGFGQAEDFDKEFASFGEEGLAKEDESGKEDREEEDRTMVAGDEEDELAKDQNGDGFGQIPSPSVSSIGSLHPDPLADLSLLTCPQEFLPSQTHHSLPNDFITSTSLAEPALSTSTLKPSPIPTPLAPPQLLSASLAPHLRPPPRAPPPSHRLVPLTLPGLTSHLNELISSALSSSLPLSHFGIPSQGLSSNSSETGYLRREVERLTSEVVERDEMIRNLSEQCRDREREQVGLRGELRELEEVCDGLGREKSELKEKEEWDKEKRKGLIRELRELEQRVEETEREKHEREQGNQEMDIGQEAREVVNENEEDETKERMNE